ncbi:AraC family transcriptional regulator [Actinospica robiniae]|uniref:AraC family transcriptional regulator n=1 Tax=Actinospica robiniae TaxID=304901 RepID=UPI00068513CE|nr:AraC family transcriptional regulator [Actinospica robiniae]
MPVGPAPEPSGLVDLRLHEPPAIAQIGIGVHGIASKRDVFLLPDLWQFHLYRYSAELVIGGIEHQIKPGMTSLVPPGTTVEFRYRGRSEHHYVHFRPAATGAPVRVRLVQDAATIAPLLTDLLQGAVTADPAFPARATADVWAALWQVSTLAAAPCPDQPHPAVAAALKVIEAELAEPLSVADIAEAVGLSHNHLTRLFRAHTGETVVAHIRRRRMRRAGHLLQASTLPIASIAAAVGIPDLQAFNKACRREFGLSPRALREAGERGAAPRPPAAKTDMTGLHG